MSTTITIGLPSKRSGDKTTKQDKEFVHAVCALANTEGGRIIVRANENERFSHKDVDDITRRLEQKTHDVFGLITVNKTMHLEKVTGGVEPSELVFNVHAWPRSLQPCTVNYNLYLATETELRQINSSETAESVVKNLVEKRRTPNGDFEFGSHHRRFTFGQVVPLRESKDTQLKCLKDGDSKKCNLVTRMQSNNLTSYVSAFANGDGGHIYYGIKTQKDGRNCVEGQVVENQDKIVSGVKKIIKKMLWPQDHGEPTRGKHWEIYFEPVLGVDEKQEPRFIAVISVAPSSRAVFTEGPESYHVVEGKVERLNYPEWEKRLRQHLISNRPPIVEIPPRVKRTDWSSKEARDTHVTVLRDLIHLRNHGDEAFFTRISQLRQTADCNGNVEIILQQQEAAYYFRKDDFKKAEKLLEENELYLPTSPEANIYEFRRLYWLCVIKRSQGELVKSDRLSTVAMQRAETLPHMLTEAWLLVNKGKKLEIDIATAYNKGELQDCERLTKECIDVYYNALGKADVAEDAKSGIVDLKQRVHFSLARIFLGCFQNQEEITRTVGWREDDLEEAAKMLEKVDSWRKNQGYTMTLLCKCEYLMTRCEQEIRNWQRFGNLDYLEEASEHSAKALKIAKKKDFKRHCCYANEQHEYLKGFQVKLKS